MDLVLEAARLDWAVHAALLRGALLPPPAARAGQSPPKVPVASLGWAGTLNQLVASARRLPAESTTPVGSTGGVTIRPADVISEKFMKLDTQGKVAQQRDQSRQSSLASWGWD